MDYLDKKTNCRMFTMARTVTRGENVI